MSAQTRYQFQIDGRAAGPIRNTWVVAAHDAVMAGYASWHGRNQLMMEATQGGSIARIAP